MKTKNTLIGVLGFVLCVGLAMSASAAQIHSAIEDASIAFRCYNGDDANVTIVITTAGAGADNTITLDGNTITIDGSGNDDTIAEFVTLLEAATNAAGTLAGDLGIFFDQDSALAADSTDGELLTDAGIVIPPGTWGNVYWDTSVAAGPGWNLYIPDNLPKGLAGWGDVTPGLSGGYAIKRVTGMPGGTGPVTASIYLNRTLVWQSVTDTGTVHAINLNTELNIPVKAGEAAIIRADRTTETTGVLTVVTE